MKNYDCIFLDRDGTINFDSGYIGSIYDFHLFDFAIPALKKMAKSGNRFCIITNQSGVSRGLIKKKKLNTIHNFIKEKFKKNQIPLLNIYSCFDHPDNPSERRKPGPGMFFEAKNDFNLDLTNCLMIGDSYIDIKAGLTLEMDTMLVLTGNGENAVRCLAEDEVPTYIVKDLDRGAKKLCL
tara:strand:+ start:276 stop:818 length:543 start_codon:yes stop_codon:yes gene_type:complete